MACKVELLPTGEQIDNGLYALRVIIGEGASRRAVELPFELESPLDDHRQLSEPVRVAALGEAFWLFRGRVVKVEDPLAFSTEEIILSVKWCVLNAEQALEKLRHEVAMLTAASAGAVARRERVSEEVRLFVWQRDRGQCNKCESREKLEFDHIIPVSLGGATTARNIQLLCERCNRAKGANLY